MLPFYTVSIITRENGSYLIIFICTLSFASAYIQHTAVSIVYQHKLPIKHIDTQSAHDFPAKARTYIRVSIYLIHVIDKVTLIAGGISTLRFFSQSNLLPTAQNPTISNMVSLTFVASVFGQVTGGNAEVAKRYLKSSAQRFESERKHYQPQLKKDGCPTDRQIPQNLAVYRNLCTGKPKDKDKPEHKHKQKKVDCHK